MKHTQSHKLRKQTRGEKGVRKNFLRFVALVLMILVIGLIRLDSQPSPSVTSPTNGVAQAAPEGVQQDPLAQTETVDAVIAEKEAAPEIVSAVSAAPERVEMEFSFQPTGVE